MTTYQQALEWLYALEAAKGMDFKLERVALALEHLGNPHRGVFRPSPNEGQGHLPPLKKGGQGGFPLLHIAGTNGKGSVAATLHAVLSAAGYRVGLYTSPHLERFNERIRIGERDIADDEVVELTREIQREVTSRGIELTFFELTTVMAFVSFARHRVDAAVIEVGLGGRLDATNVLDPLVSVITNIGYDHAEYLGHTLASIAAEKGGIIKPRRPVVLGRMRPAAARVLRRIAREHAAPICEHGRDFRLEGGERPRFRGAGLDLDGLEIGLRGEFQRENAATALAALGIVHERLPVDEAAIRRGLREVRWPGRLELLPGAPAVLLDGAHNLEGMRALAAEVRRLASGRRVHAVFAVMQDKPWQRMVDALGPLCASATVTHVLPPRGLAPERAAAAFARHCPTRVEPAPLRALARARDGAADGDLIVVAGSLFLIAAVQAACRQTAERKAPAYGQPEPLRN